jgi:hypothetical protein
MPSGDVPDALLVVMMDRDRTILGARPRSRVARKRDTRVRQRNTQSTPHEHAPCLTVISHKGGRSIADQS